jgi:hypothetical protein
MGMRAAAAADLGEALWTRMGEHIEESAEEADGRHVGCEREEEGKTPSW